MEKLSKKSSSERRRRLPKPSHGIDVNFCRNPQCDFFMEPPDPYDNRGRNSAIVKSNEPRGKVGGSGDDKSFECGCCGRSTVIKNNKAIVEEYRRLRGRFKPDAPRDACSEFLCKNAGRSASFFPDLYRNSGKTAKGDQRWKCKVCLTTFSVGSRIRRQKKSSQNNTILWMITN